MKQDYGLGADAHVPSDLTRAAAHALINGWRRLRPPTKDLLVDAVLYSRLELMLVGTRAQASGY